MNNSGVERALVIGDGGWGTTLAMLLCARGVPTVLWSHDPKDSEELRRTRLNERCLPGVSLPESLMFSADPFSAAEGVDMVVSAVPTQFLRSVAERFADALPGGVALISASKGLEIESLNPPSQILRDVLGIKQVCILTGPSHAEEVARGLPATVVAAAHDKAFAQRVQVAFTSDTFRVYTHTDPLGAELAGALKNVIAIAAGISDGLGLGDNAKSALLTRGMVEMARYGVGRGGKLETFFGLAGIGDLVTTCCSKHSRNRSVGEAIGRGEKLQSLLSKMNMVAEGVWTTKALFGPEAENQGGVSMPIAEQVHAVLFEDKSPREAVLDLMRREPAEEMKGLV
ncbi:MAG TPA: NAD(P)H-dependent glycerol-3-phosphate dehydrogenase [Planctomycetota bacterium]|nr:NAD(P)H-dependent glycerol-3-phosphate dehydrogenase [Planctomycetota bacterium]